MDDFTRWLRHNGAAPAGLEVHEFQDTGRGLLIIATADRDEPSEVAGRFRACPDPPAARLCYALLRERARGRSSFWWPYLQVLPTQLLTSINLPVDVCSSLFASTYLAGMVARRRKALALEKAAVFGALKKDGVALPSDEEFVWASGIVQTRCCYMTTAPVRGAAPSCCLVPYADFLNHSPDAQTDAGLNAATGCYEIRTLTGCAEGAQAFICYGQHDSAVLMSLYGIVPPANAAHKVVLDTEIELLLQGLAREDKRMPAKREICSRLLGLPTPQNCTVSRGGEVSWNTLAMLRVLLMSESEQSRRLYNSVPNDDAVSPENEARVRRSLLSVLSQVVARIAEAERAAGARGQQAGEYVALCAQSLRAQDMAIVQDAVERLLGHERQQKVQDAAAADASRPPKRQKF
eukprot:m51a1_g4202 hypothetical protein (406) ;mRNA; r:11865-13964